MFIPIQPCLFTPTPSQDCCLVDSLNNIGFCVPYTADGPFSIRDAEGWIASTGYAIDRVNHLGMHRVVPGKYIVTYGTGPGVVGHAVAAIVTPNGFVIVDGPSKAKYSGLVQWHALPGGVHMSTSTWWHVHK